ncbi:peptidase inhibitor family I36 protein, partial [Actinomadura geliboluensis]
MLRRTARLIPRVVAAAAAMAVGGAVLLPASPASAASRNGVCESGEFCYYFNSDNAGSVSDFTGSIADYGTTQPSCYDFKGTGNGKGQCIKNQAASVWNRSTKTVRVYYNSNYGGTYQDFKAGAKGNLNSSLKN